MDKTKYYQDGWWITKDLDVIHCSELSDNHLINILRYMQRKAYAYEQQKVIAYYGLPEPNGEMAQLAFEQELDTLENADIAGWWLDNHPFMVHLLDEINYRDLLNDELR